MSQKTESLKHERQGKRILPEKSVDIPDWEMEQVHKRVHSEKTTPEFKCSRVTTNTYTHIYVIWVCGHDLMLQIFL